MFNASDYYETSEGGTVATETVLSCGGPSGLLVCSWRGIGPSGGGGAGLE